MYTNETDRMLAEGGVMQEGNTVDPVSGNDVPPGALQEEVRDDIDAKLSEGEFVFPADVVRYIGLSTLMKMRDKAKEGLKKMEDIGQMGNAEEVANAEALHGGDESKEMDDESFSAEVDSIMNENMGTEEQAFAEGGYVDPANAPLYKSAPIKGFEMVAMTNESGNTIYIPHINGKPLLRIPAGYIAKKGILPTIEDPTAPVRNKDAPIDSGGGGGGSGSGTTPSPGVGALPSLDSEGRAVAAKTGLSDKQAGILGTVVGLVTGVPLLGLAARYGNQKANESYAKDAAALNTQFGDIMGADSGVLGGPTATMGVGGTGGQAANAGASAAAAATAAGYSSAAVGAAAQAAAGAVVGGASATAAAEAGRTAAAVVDGTTDPMDFGNIEGRGTRSSVDSSVNISSRGGSTGSIGPQTTVDENGQVVSIDNSVTVGGPISAPDITTTDTGILGSNDTTAAADNSGNTSGGGPDGSPSGAGTADGGDGWARGGFIKKKNKPAVKSKRGLASR